MDGSQLFTLFTTPDLQLTQPQEEVSHELAAHILEVVKSVKFEMYKHSHVGLKGTVEAMVDCQAGDFIRDAKSKISVDLYPTVGVRTGQIILKHLLGQDISREVLEAHLQAVITIAGRGNPLVEPTIKLQQKCVEWRDFLGAEATCLKDFTSAVFCNLHADTSPATQSRNARMFGVNMQVLLRYYLQKCDQRNEPHDYGAEIRTKTVAALTAWKEKGPEGKLVHNLGWDRETSDALFEGLLEGFVKPVEEQDPIEGFRSEKF
ncbi:hypothetical protein DL98DRAFT_593872 [Cadophora sp. DSE1049]|nr:hypothetical protein DL98DRAFT_593872 [Cadophora sp. DSE1049]